MSTMPAISNSHIPKEKNFRVRRLVASLGALGAAGAFAWFFFEEANGDTDAVTLLLPFVGLLAASGLAWCRGLAPQVLARAFCWSALVFGFFISLFATGVDSLGPVAITFGSGLALLALGQMGLDKQNRDVSSFSPAAFAGPLTAGLVMAIADLQTLTMWGGIAAMNNDEWTGVGLLVGAAVMFVAIVGLFRLKMWGVVLNLVANFAIAGFALLSSELPEPLGYCLAGTAILQLILPAPMLIAMITKKVPKPASRGLGLIAPLAIVAIMITSVAMWDTNIMF